MIYAKLLWKDNQIGQEFSDFSVKTDTHTEIFYFAGTKSDLRDDPKVLENLQKRIKKPVSEQAGRDLAKVGTNNLLRRIIDSFPQILKWKIKASFVSP